MAAAWLLVAVAPANAAVLYDQYDNGASSASTSQDFETSNDAFDSRLADDFVVPAGQAWSVDGVDVDGQYFNGSGPAASVNVNFYANTSGNFPGTLVASRPTSAFTGAASGDFVISLSAPVALSSGTYWVSVQSRQDYSTAGEWGWEDRTVTSNAGAAFQNPGGGFGCGSSWVRKSTCNTTAGGVDQVFRLRGTVIPHVLYDQYDNAASSGSNSQDFETANDGFDDQLADDFVVPAGQDWSIDGVDVDGLYFNGSGPAASVNVNFYANASGNFPGSLVESRPTTPFTGAATGDFVLSLNAPISLSPGTYWVSVQAQQNFSPAGQWAWMDRTVTSNAGAAFQAPNGGFGAPCAAWVRKPTCVAGTTAAADQVFRLRGAVLRTLTVAKTGAGSGTVDSSPAGISCGASCTKDFANGTSVTLTASPDSGSNFEGWSGGGCSDTGACTVAMDAAKTVTAVFVRQAHALTVAKAGAGSGTVTSDPAGIDCGASCTHVYDHGTSVTLTPTPVPGSSFTGWSGDDCSGTGLCTLDVDADMTATATFADTAAGPGVGPDTKITKVKVKRKKHKAKFAFTGSGGTAPLTFQCRLDHEAFAPCSSPASYKHLKGGKHTFEVAAKDSSGKIDPTPASDAFKIKRKR